MQELAVMRVKGLCTYHNYVIILLSSSIIMNSFGNLSLCIEIKGRI